jgi:hypothetical protein
MEVARIFGTFKEALVITSFVLMILLIVEYIHVQTRGSWEGYLRKKGWVQILIAGLLGATPGCIGAFTVVSLYTHGITGFSALVTTMIATFGDEAFVVLAMIPDTGLLLIATTFLIGILTGFILYRFEKRKGGSGFVPRGHLVIHAEEEEACRCFSLATLRANYASLSFARAILLSGFALFFLFLLTGDIGPERWNWIKVTFVILLSVTIFIIATVPEHFIQEHLWKHVIRKHLWRIFLWTWGTFLVLLFLEQFLHVNEWIRNNAAYMILLAILLGIIPESGPHMIFITLFAQGHIPFSVLLASSIVQDGHGMLPLLAESRRDFVRVKLINMAVGAIIGYGLLILGG